MRTFTDAAYAPALLALAGYVAWTLLVVLAIVLARGLVVLRGERQMNQFPSGEKHGGDRYWRLNRAHANLVENLPIVAVLVIVGTLARVESRAFTWLPVVALGARVVQTTAHVASGSVLAVTVRFTGFFTQWICFAWMLVLVALRLS